MATTALDRAFSATTGASSAARHHHHNDNGGGGSRTVTLAIDAPTCSIVGDVVAGAVTPSATPTGAATITPRRRATTAPGRGGGGGALFSSPSSPRHGGVNNNVGSPRVVDQLLLVRQGSAPCLDPPARVRDWGLFIGSADAERSARALAAAGITHVLQCGAAAELPAHHAAGAAAAAGNTLPIISYHRVVLSDEDVEDLLGALGPAFAFIDAARRANGRVLVHCAAGQSRSGAVVVAYLMARERVGFEDALAAVRAARPVVGPNEGFEAQLREFEAAGWALDGWKGWGAARLQASLARRSSSGRRVVRGVSDLVRRFHCHALDDGGDTVWRDDDTILEL